MEQLIAAAVGAGSMIGAYLMYLGIKRIPALVTKIKGWFTTGKAELVQIESVLTADIAALVARVEALEGKLGAVRAIGPEPVTGPVSIAAQSASAPGH